MMGRDIVIGLLTLFLVLLSAIAFETSRMVWTNWDKFRTWRSQDRETREDMALWLGMPLMKIGMLIFAGDALVSLMQGNPVSERMAVRGLVVLPLLVVATAILLWMVFSARYGSGAGDRLWLRVVALAVASGNGLFMFAWLV